MAVLLGITWRVASHHAAPASIEPRTRPARVHAHARKEVANALYSTLRSARNGLLQILYKAHTRRKTQHWVTDVRGRAYPGNHLSVAAPQNRAERDVSKRSKGTPPIKYLSVHATQHYRAKDYPIPKEATDMWRN